MLKSQLLKWKDNNNHHVLIFKNENGEENKILFSYNSPVVEIKNNMFGKLLTLGENYNYSKTTRKYVNQFVAEEYNLPLEEAKDMIENHVKGIVEIEDYIV